MFLLIKKSTHHPYWLLLTVSHSVLPKTTQALAAVSDRQS
jgi:hypothetical protein